MDTSHCIELQLNYMDLSCDLHAASSHLETCKLLAQSPAMGGSAEIA